MINLITSNSNSIVKRVAALQQKKYRDESNLFVVEGLHLTEEALNSGWKIEVGFIAQDTKFDVRYQEILSRLCQRCSVYELPSPIYKKVSETESPQGIMAVVSRKKYLLADLVQQEKSILVIMDRIQDPGNVGTIIRTADAAGSTGVMLTRGCADIFAGKTVRSSMGSIFHLPIITDCDAEEIVSFFRQQDILLVVTDLHQSDNLYHVDLKRNIAIAFGNEGSGVCNNLCKFAQTRIKIPIHGKAESLNVASSAAVILYEVLRQQQYGQ